MNMFKIMSTLALSSVLLLSACGNNDEKPSVDDGKLEVFNNETDEQDKTSSENADGKDKNETESTKNDDQTEKSEEQDNKSDKESEKSTDKSDEHGIMETEGIYNIHKDDKTLEDARVEYLSDSDFFELSDAIVESLHNGSVASNIQIDNFENYMKSTYGLNIEPKTLESLRNIVKDDTKIVYNGYIPRIGSILREEKDNVFLLSIPVVYLPIEDKEQNEDDEIAKEEKLIKAIEPLNVGDSTEIVNEKALPVYVYYTVHLNKDKTQGTLKMENKKWYEGQKGDFYDY